MLPASPETQYPRGRVPPILWLTPADRRRTDVQHCDDHESRPSSEATELPPSYLVASAPGKLEALRPGRLFRPPPRPLVRLRLLLRHLLAHDRCPDLRRAPARRPAGLRRPYEVRRGQSVNLRQFIERIERLEEEKAAIQGDIKDVIGEAKGRGYDTKAIRTIIRLRKKDANERIEEETILQTYMAALGME